MPFNYDPIEDLDQVHPDHIDVLFHSPINDTRFGDLGDLEEFEQQFEEPATPSMFD